MSKYSSAMANAAMLHNKRISDIFVLLSADGSTLVIDPGLNRPWSSPNRRLAEAHAKNLTKQGLFCSAVDSTTALASVLRHPKNQPLS